MFAKAICRRQHESRCAVVVNCGAFPPSLLESVAVWLCERSFYRRGEEHGRFFFEQAHDGTLFLDEIGELPLQAQ